MLSNLALIASSRLKTIVTYPFPSLRTPFVHSLYRRCVNLLMDIMARNSSEGKRRSRFIEEPDLLIDHSDVSEDDFDDTDARVAESDTTVRPSDLPPFPPAPPASAYNGTLPNKPKQNGINFNAAGPNPMTLRVELLKRLNNARDDVQKFKDSTRLARSRMMHLAKETEAARVEVSEERWAQRWAAEDVEECLRKLEMLEEQKSKRHNIDDIILLDEPRRSGGKKAKKHIDLFPADDVEAWQWPEHSTPMDPFAPPFPPVKGPDDTRRSRQRSTSPSSRSSRSASPEPRHREGRLPSHARPVGRRSDRSLTRRAALDLPISKRSTGQKQRPWIDYIPSPPPPPPPAPIDYNGRSSRRRRRTDDSEDDEDRPARRVRFGRNRAFHISPPPEVFPEYL